MVEASSWARLALALAFVTATFAGCLSSSGGSDVEPADSERIHESRSHVLSSIEDVSGDAVENGAAFGFDVAHDHCNVVAVLGPTCRGQLAVLRAALGVNPGPGPPAPAPLDLRQVVFTENATTLQITFVVAGLESLDDAVVHDLRSKGTTWAACWSESCGGLSVQSNNGMVVTQSFFERSQRGCSDRWYWCGWSIPWEIEFGTPAKIHVFVPRDVLADDALESPVGVTLRAERVGARVDYYAGADPAGAWGNTGRRVFVLSDRTDVGEDLMLAAPEGPPKRWEPVVTGWAGDVSRTDVWGDRPYVDLLEQRLVENATHFLFAMKMVDVPTEARPDYHFIVFFGLEHHPMAVVGASAEGDAPYPWGFRCEDGACEDLTATLERVTGAGGWVNLSVPRSELGTPSAGHLVDFLLVNTRTYHQTWDKSAGPAWFGGTAGWLDDWNRLFPPYRLVVDTEAP